MSSETLERPPAALPEPASVSAAADDLALFHRTLSELCRAQVPLARALELLRNDLRSGRLREAVGKMAASVEEGFPLADAYAHHREHFPELYRALIGAGIASGNLPGMLDEIARHAQERARIAERMRRALAYPVVAAGFVIAIGTILVAFVAPQLRSAMSSAAMQPGAAPRDAGFGWLLPGAGLAVLIAGVAAALLFAWIRSPLDAGSALSGLGYRLPLVGRLRLYAAKASFASTMALLARRSLPLPKALALAAAASGDRGIRNAVDTMVASAADGASLTEAVRAGDLISPSLLWLIEAAESSGSAADALEDVARIYRERLERAVDRVCTLATPLAELLLGLVVLGFALSYMLPAVRFADVLFGH